jgi:hypothetical protein
VSTRAGTDGPEEPPGNELAVLLWVVAVLIASFELTWWFFDRLYS